jgi:hypothetical protein
VTTDNNMSAEERRVWAMSQRKPIPRWLIIAVAVLGIALAGWIASDWLASISPAAPRLDTSPSMVNSSAPTTAPVAPASYSPTPADFTLDVIVTSKQCFGANACNYTYRVDPHYVGAQPLPDKKLTAIYTVTGGGQSYFGGDKDQVQNFTVDKDGTARGSSGLLVAIPDGAKFVATVTRVIVEES